LTIADTGSFSASSGNPALLSDPAGTDERPEIADGLLLDLKEVRNSDGSLGTQLTESDRNKGGFRTRCGVSHFSYEDPLVHGDKPTKKGAHLHMFFGNTSAGKNSVNDQNNQSDPNHLRNHDSTCGDLGKHNKSAYWIPALFNGAGQVVMPSQINVYYKTLPEWDNGENQAEVYASNGSDLSGMRPIPNDLKMVGHKGRVQITQRDSKEFLVASVEFMDCMELNADGSPRERTEATYGAFNMAVKENYHMVKNSEIGDAARVGKSCQETSDGTKYARIPSLEFNIQWELNASGLTRTNWEFSNGKGYSALPAADQPKFSQNFENVAMPHLHGDYMAAWTNNAWTFDSSWTAGNDAMSELVEALRQPHSWVFHNEFSNLSNVQRTTKAGGGDLLDDSGGLMTGTLTVTALGNALPGEIPD